MEECERWRSCCIHIFLTLLIRRPWGPERSGGKPQTKAFLILTAHVSAFKDPRAPAQIEGHRNDIQAIVIQEKFVHFSNSLSSREGFFFFFPFFHFQAILKVLAGGLPQPRCCCFCFYCSSKPYMTLLLEEIRSEWLGNVAERYSSTKSPCCGRLQIGKPENVSLAASTHRSGCVVGTSKLAG